MTVLVNNAGIIGFCAFADITVEAWERMMLNTSTMPVRPRQLAILRVAWTRRAEYMWASHMRLSLALGLTPEDFEAVKAGPEAPCWSEAERAVLRGVEQLRETRRRSRTARTRENCWPWSTAA